MQAAAEQQQQQQQQLRPQDVYLYP